MTRNNIRNTAQPEINDVNTSRESNNNRIRMRNPTVREYFQSNDNIRYEGYIDNMKLNGNIRILSLNPHGCKPKDTSKMTDLKNAIQKYDIDVIMMNETNTKWTTVNISKMERWMRSISRGAQIFTADSKEWSSTNNDYLPGGIMTVLLERCGPYIDKKTIKIGRLGNWNAISLKYNKKRVEIINLYRLPLSSSNGPCCSRTQYMRIDGEIKSTSTYRSEIFKEIQQYIQSQDITDVIIAGDYNQGISDNAVQKFHSEIGVSEVHCKINNISIDRLDKTYKYGSKAIDSIAVSSGLIDYVEGCKLVTYNEIVETDHRGYIIDISLEEYFEGEFSSWDSINRVILNPSKRSHREKFVESIEDQLSTYQLENELEQMQIQSNRHHIEKMDEMITKIFQVALRKVEGMKRNVPYSKQKEKQRAKLLYRKMQVRRLKGILIDNEVMEKKRRIAQIEEFETMDIEEAKRAVNQAKEEWNEIVKEGKAIRERELLDYHHTEIVCENDDQIKSKKKIINGIKRTLNKMHSFRYISRHVGRGDREGIKRLHVVDNNECIQETYVNRDRIEKEISKFNENHFKKAHNTIAYKDKIYEKLREDHTRNKIIRGTLSRNECDDDRVYDFLKLLKVPRHRRHQHKEMTCEDWIKVVKRSKKRSASSIFSRRNYAVYKCALGSDRMTKILVAFYNILIDKGYYPCRWIKILDVMLGKGKGMIIGKLRTITLIEADLQLIMRIYFDDQEEEIIESDERFSKANYGSRKNYSIESAILEKRLAFDNSLINGNNTIYHLTDLQSCYDRQLVNIGGMVEESAGRSRKVIQLITKVIPNWQHFISTNFGISSEYYGGQNNKLAGTGQGNRFSGDVCRDTSCLIMKVIEQEKVGMRLESVITKRDEVITSVMFVDDADMVSEGENAEANMQRILEIYNKLYSATGGYIEDKKCKYFSWKWHWKQGKKVIKNMKVEIKVNNEEITQIDSINSERSLGVYMSPSLVWHKQFEIMKNKMREAIFKLNNTNMVASNASMYYNMYLIKKVYFGCGVININQRQEEDLKKIYEPVILRKLGLSKNFPRSVLYSRKTALGVGLMAPKTIMDGLALKLYLGHQRSEDRISKIIQIIEDNASTQYGYGKSVMEVNKDVKPSTITWSDEIQDKMMKRGIILENRINEPSKFTVNKTIMDMVSEYVHEMNKTKDDIAPLNQVRIWKQMRLPCELVGFYGMVKTKEARDDKSISCVRWKIPFEKVPRPSNKSFKMWREFVNWLVQKRIETIVDFSCDIETAYSISDDEKYIKYLTDTESIYKRKEGRYSQYIYEKVDECIETEWKKMIAEMKPNGEVKIYGILHINARNNQNEWIQGFRDEIVKSIEERRAFAASDASVKNGKMAGCWIIANESEVDLENHEIYHKRWYQNTSGAAEVLILLELIKVIERKGRNINHGKITIGIDYKRVYRKIVTKIKKSSEYAQEAGAEIAEIKRLLKDIKFEVEIKLLKGHEENIGLYQRNQLKHLIRQCDQRAKKKREGITNEMNITNVKYYGIYNIHKDGIPQMRSIKEVIRIIDATQEERNHIRRKYGYKEEFIDIEARNAFIGNKVTTSMIKCANGFNHYGLRHAMINGNMVEANCPRCNQVETWDHVIKCRETVALRKEFIQKLVVELVEGKPSNVSIELIMSFVEDILRYIEDENEEDYETNQYLVGMMELFRGYVVVDWEGANVNDDKFRVLNIIVVKQCVEFYMKCWKHRNQAYHDDEKQKSRIKNWFRKEKENALNSNMRQLREYATKFDINIDRCSLETIKIWIKNKKILEKKIKEVPINDIRRYLNLEMGSNISKKN